jgi:2',3'-cyclic-nucleotide 2'-phosphodiesterase (5'-nucleotidase family)
VIAMHMGLEADLNSGEINPGQVLDENTAIAIAKGVGRVDVILMGHTHRDVPALFLQSDFVRLKEVKDPSLDRVSYAGVLLTQADYWGKHVARVDLYLDKDQSGHWRVGAKSARTIATDSSVEPDSESLQLAEPYDRETNNWLTRVIGQSSEELSAREGRFRDTAILDLIQQVQMEAGKADVSLVANFNTEARIPKGSVTVREIAGLYVYENTLVVLEVTGRQLKEALEHSAKYFRAYEPGKAATELVDEKMPAYNFDIAEGVNYDLELSKPFGERIQKLSFRGNPVTPEQKFRLATNNYRANGGGGYTMYKDAPVVYRSSELIRDLIIDWVERHKTIPTQPSNNWRIVS